MTACAVHGANACLSPENNFPSAALDIPSTSFSGAIDSTICDSLSCAGSGRNSKMPSIVGSSFMAANFAEKSSIEMSAGNTNSFVSIPTPLIRLRALLS